MQNEVAGPSSRSAEEVPSSSCWKAYAVESQVKRILIERPGVRVHVER